MVCGYVRNERKGLPKTNWASKSAGCCIGGFLNPGRPLHVILSFVVTYSLFLPQKYNSALYARSVPQQNEALIAIDGHPRPLHRLPR